MSTPFDGGGNSYGFRGVPPIVLPNIRTFLIDSIGVLSNVIECNSNDVIFNFTYTSGTTNLSDSTEIITLANLTTGYINNQGNDVGSIRIDSLPSRGQLFLNNSAVTIGQTITALDISNNNLVFYALNQDISGQVGDFSTSFNFTIISETNVVGNTVTARLNASDTSIVQDLVILSPEISNSCYSLIFFTVNVPQGESRQLNVIRSGLAPYLLESEIQDADENATIIEQNTTMIISQTTNFGVGISAISMGGGSEGTTTITISLTGQDNDIVLSRLHDLPITQC